MLSEIIKYRIRTWKVYIKWRRSKIYIPFQSFFLSDSMISFWFAALSLRVKWLTTYFFGYKWLLYFSKGDCWGSTRLIYMYHKPIKASILCSAINMLHVSEPRRALCFSSLFCYCCRLNECYLHMYVHMFI